jgi:hypothetical protein
LGEKFNLPSYVSYPLFFIQNIIPRRHHHHHHHHHLQGFGLLTRSDSRETGPSVSSNVGLSPFFVLGGNETAS